MEALGRLVGSAESVVPAEELCGFDNLVPLRARIGGEERLHVGFVTPDTAVAFDHPHDASRRRGGPELAAAALATFEHVVDVTPEPFSWYDTGTPRRVRWIEDDFYEIEGPYATALVYAQWSPDRTLRRFIPGYGFGAPEAQVAGTPLDFDAVPLDAAFRVVWGGRSIGDNRHFYHRRQRYGVDLESDPYIDGAAVIAPVGGIVVESRDDVDDNPAFVPAPAGAPPFGNYVTIRSGGHDVVLCHLRRGSIAVAPFARVCPGTPLGRVGNSGNSSIPHLHCHVETTGVVSHGVPVRFPVAGEHREPLRGAFWATAGRTLEAR